jgi:hypothetical protein
LAIRRRGYGGQLAEALCVERARFLVELTDERDVNGDIALPVT